MSLKEMTPAEAHALLRDKLGQRIALVSDHMNYKAGSEWFIKSVQNLGGTCVVAVTPPAGGKGFFAPYKNFEFADEFAPAEPVVEDTPAPAPLPFTGDPAGPRNEFVLEGFDEDAPLYALFRNVAPDTDSARELFLTYSAEYSEFDTEFFEDLMKAANVRPGVFWTATAVTQMLMLLNESQTSEPAVEPDEDENGPTVAARMRKILDEQAVVPEVAQPEPAAPVLPTPTLVSDLSGPEPAAPKRRGRPPKNRTEVPEQPAVRVVEEPVLARALDNLPSAKEIATRHYSDYLEPETTEIPESKLPPLRVVAVLDEQPAAKPVFAPSPTALQLAANLMLDVGVDENPEMLLEQVIGIVRRALLLDD